MDQLLGVLIKKVNNDFQRYSELEAKRIGMTQVQMSIINFLDRHKNQGDLYQTDIEHEFNIQKSTATTLLKLMERKDLITRSASQKDSRYKKILLTKNANRYATRIDQFYQQNNKELRRVLGDKNTDAFVDSLYQIQKYFDDKLN